MLEDLYKKWSAGNAIETDFMQDYTDLGKFIEKLYDEIRTVCMLLNGNDPWI